MYEGDPYGDEIEGGDDDKNDGLNALVNNDSCLIFILIESSICDWFQQRHRPGCAQSNYLGETCKF